MKKVLLGLVIVLLAACTPGSKPTGGSQPAPPPLAAGPLGIITKGSTLDGLPFAQAHDWVTNFKKDKTNKVPFTSVWFSRYWVKETRKILDAEKASGVDGIRIYFAKNSAMQNVLVAIATKDGGVDPKHPEVHIHHDFFDHKTASFIRGTANNADITEEYAANGGTDLFNFKPENITSNCIPRDVNHVLDITAAAKYIHGFDTSDINTDSEWYPTTLIDDIDDELDAAAAIAANDQSKLPPDGLRVYFGKDDDGFNMLVFVTTQKYKDSSGAKLHKDNFECYIDNDTKHPLVPFNRGGFDRGEKCPVYCTGGDLPCDTCSTEEKRLVNTPVKK